LILGVLYYLFSDRIIEIVKDFIDK
jgi:hypothetical protein